MRKMTDEEIMLMSEGVRDPKPEIEAKAAFGCLVLMAMCLIGAVGVFALVAAIVNLMS